MNLKNIKTINCNLFSYLFKNIGDLFILMKDLKILFIGDIFAQVGRNLVVKNLTSLIDIHNVDFVVANGENVTHGRSLSL